jgi:hypothetical protein
VHVAVVSQHPAGCASQRLTDLASLWWCALLCHKPEAQQQGWCNAQDVELEARCNKDDAEMEARCSRGVKLREA